MKDTDPKHSESQSEGAAYRDKWLANMVRDYNAAVESRDRHQRMADEDERQAGRIEQAIDLAEPTDEEARRLGWIVR